MNRHPWRIDTIGDGSLAWVYLRPHKVAWSSPSAAVTGAGYTVTAERQSLVDDGWAQNPAGLRLSDAATRATGQSPSSDAD